MIISFKHQATFLAVPRTASRSIHQWFVDTGGEDQTKVFGGFHERELPGEMTKWFSFATVRHPYTRAVSFWMKAMHVGDFKQELINDPKVVVDNLYTRCGGEQSFESFVRWLTRKRIGDPLEWGTMTNFIHGVHIDKLLRFEILHRDFHRLPFVKKTDELPWIGKQLGDDDWRKHYENPDVLDAVRRWAALDFENFGYCPRYHLTGKPFVT